MKDEKYMECWHVFHMTCMLEWLQTCHDKGRSKSCLFNILPTYPWIKFIWPIQPLNIQLFVVTLSCGFQYLFKFPKSLTMKCTSLCMLEWLQTCHDKGRSKSCPVCRTHWENCTY
jgi:hypothetical protein